MAKLYDLVVVGAGPAGLLAAKAAAEAGLNVAVIEKKSESDMIKLKRSCAQTILSMQEPYMNNIVVYNPRDKRIVFTGDGFSVPYDGPYRNIYGWYFFAPNGHCIKLGDTEAARKTGDSARTAIVCDKDALFNSLINELKKLHVEIFPGVLVDSITKKEKSVEVSGGGKSFDGRYLVAADGVNSVIAEKLGLNEGRYFWCNLRAISFYVKNLKVPDPNVVITSTGYFSPSTALFFVAPRPNPDEYNVQFMSIDPEIDLKRAREYFTKESFAAPWFEGAEILNSFSAACSCYDPIETGYDGRVILAGDVGSTQELENTGAMICGWKAGNAAATALREENLGLEISALDKYSDWWKNTYIDAYDHAAYMKNWVLGFVLDKEEDMNYAFGLIKDPMPANFNPYSGPKMMGRTMGQLAPQIQQERPDVFEKLGRLRVPLKELYQPMNQKTKPIVGD